MKRNKIGHSVKHNPIPNPTSNVRTNSTKKQSSQPAMVNNSFVKRDPNKRGEDAIAGHGPCCQAEKPEKKTQNVNESIQQKKALQICKMSSRSCKPLTDMLSHVSRCDSVVPKGPVAEK